MDVHSCDPGCPSPVVLRAGEATCCRGLQKALEGYVQFFGKNRSTFLKPSTEDVLRAREAMCGLSRPQNSPRADQSDHILE